MARSSTFPRLTIHMILLLVGFLLISTPLYTYYYPGFDWGGHRTGVPSTHSEILTEESPLFRFNVTSDSSTVEISSLHTNDTPVTLLVRGPTHVQFNAANITSLEGCPIEVKIVESDLWIEVMRQGLDANITITLVCLSAYTITITAPQFPALNTIHIFGWILSIYAFVQLAFISTRSRFPHIVKLGLAIAFVLVLVGTSCCNPIIRGHVEHDFYPVYTLVTLPDEEFSFLLNETRPSSSLNLSSLFSGDGTVVTYKVHTIISSDYPVTLAISNEGESAFVLEEECQNSNWWFPVPVTSNRSILFDFGRVDSDAEVTLRVGITYRTLLPREDITLPADLCAIGIAVMAFGLGLTVMVDRYFSSESNSSRDRRLL